MKRIFNLVLLSICVVLLCACSKNGSEEVQSKWDCSVACAKESADDNYVITYSDEEIISNTGIISVQNRNDFDIVVHLFADGQEERKIEISAGGVSVLHQIKKEQVYTIGCHAAVKENTEIKLMIYDGEKGEVY